MSSIRKIVIQKELEKQRFILPFHIMRSNQNEASQGEIVGNDQFSSVSVSSTPKVSSSETSGSRKDDIGANPFFDKYADKIRAAKAKQQSNEQSASTVEKVDTEMVKEEVKQMNLLEHSLSRTHEQSKEAKSISSRKTLGDIVHLDKLKDLTPQEVENVWRAHHSSQKDTIYSILKASEYDLIYENASKYPIFVLPLPRSMSANETGTSEEQQEGYQMFLSRFAQHTFYFTPLAQFQQLQDAAIPSFVMNHFPELSSSKKIVLLNGTFDSGLLNVIEVQCLANQIKLFYCTDDPARLLLLHKINCEPNKFDHMEVIHQLEKQL